MFNRIVWMWRAFLEFVFEDGSLFHLYRESCDLEEWAAREATDQARREALAGFEKAKAAMYARAKAVS